MKKYTLTILEEVKETPGPTMATQTTYRNGDPVEPKYIGPILYEENPPDFNVPDTIFVNPKSETVEWKDPETDKSSFSKIRRSGRIKMSRYRRGSISISYPTFRVFGEDKRIEGSWRFRMPGESYIRGLPSGGTHSVLLGRWPYLEYLIGPFTYYQVGRVDEIRGYSDYGTPGTLLSHIPDISSEIETLKSDVATRLHKRWDALTDMVEARSTLNTAKSLLQTARNPLAGFKAFRERAHRNHGGKAAGYDKEIRSKWLELRYGIMPTMYSIQDVMKLLEEKDKEYLTERARRQIDIKSPVLPDTEGVFTVSEGFIRLNATARARFEKPSSRLIGGTSLNVINTLWEVIPYSLVVDWFANVGDYLYHRSSIYPSSFESQMCYSIRRKIKHTTFVRVRNPSGSLTDHPIRIEEEDTYERIPFNRSDIQLSFNPRFSSWKRWADAYALSVGPLTRALRRLK